MTATIKRIGAQLRHDPRTVGLILIVPAFLLVILYFVFKDAPVLPGQAPLFDRVGPIMLAILPMFLMFIVTSVVMLRERTSGTLERIFTTPMTQAGLVAAYATVFSILAILQSLILALLIFVVFDVSIAGQPAILVLISALCALIGVAFGLMASAFARNEFQAVQFMPIFVVPQIFLCGLFVDVEHMPGVLEAIAKVMPMTWAVDVVKETLSLPDISSGSWIRLAGLLLAALAALVGAAASMPRKTD